MSRQTILVIGDGDFSFSKSVERYVNQNKQFTIVSTCYESYDGVINKYSQAKNNIEFLKLNGVIVKTSIDGTNLSTSHFDIKFDIIIFNFPHRGGKSNIKNNRILLRDFFKSVKESGVLIDGGCVCVSLCQGQAGTSIDLVDRSHGDSWQIEDMASLSAFHLFEVRKFDVQPFGDYIPTGFRSQEKRFRLEGARTYVFVASSYQIGLLGNRDTLNHAVVDEFLLEVAQSTVVREWSVGCCGNSDTDCHRTDDWFADTHRLCRSPWQQVVEILASPAPPLPMVTHGCCLIDAIIVHTFIVSLEPLKTTPATDGHSNTVGIGSDDLDLLLQGEVEVIDTGVAVLMHGLQFTIATVRHRATNRYTVVKVCNVSQCLADLLTLDSRDTFVSLTAVARHLSQALNAVYPTPISLSQLPGIPVYLASRYGDVIRVLRQRRDIDTHCTRDMSFWLPSPSNTLYDSGAIDLDRLLSRVEAVCWHVLGGHLDARVRIVDCYHGDGDDSQSVCVRVQIRSLGRQGANERMDEVAALCQRLLDVRVR